MPSRISSTLLICILGAAVAVGALFLPARDTAAPPTPQTSGPAQVSIQAFTFTDVGPLQPGQELVVTNNDSVPHTLTANDGSFDTGLLQPGEQAVIAAPSSAGAFAFFCEVHPAMTGELVVAA